MQLFNTFLAVAILLISNLSIAADNDKAEALTETWYQIEILVYEPTQQSIAGEVWPAVTEEDLPENIIELATIDIAKPKATQVDAFQQLAPETLILSKIATKLTSSRRYRIITLQGWQQPVKQRNEAESVHLTDKLPNIEDESQAITTTENGEIILNQPRAISTEEIEPIADELSEIPAKIDGTVTVSLLRYLHMSLKLRYYNPDVYLSEQIALQKPDELVVEKFMMQQSRRMRSKEVHVFDHPYFGVITTITPIKRVISTKKK